MKKTFLFALPVVSVMLLSGCAKKGKPTEVGTALPYAIEALNTMVTQDNVSATLSGSMDMKVNQKIYYYNYYTGNYKFGYSNQDMQFQKLKVTAAVKGLNQQFNQLTASATASGKVKLNIYNSISQESDKPIEFSFDNNVDSKAYLQGGVSYIDLDKGLAGLINGIYYLNTGKSTLIQDGKYYYAIPLDGNASITNDYIVPWYEGIRSRLVSTISSIPAEALQYLSATKYSQTKYGITIQGSLLEIMKLFGTNVVYGKDDTADGKLNVIYDINSGIQEISFKYNIDYDVTFAEQYADSSYIPDFIKDHANETAVESKGNFDLKMTFAYDKKVKVSTLKNTGEYTKPLTGGSSSGQGGNDDPVNPPVGPVEPETKSLVTLDEFRNIFANLDNNDVVPSIVNINGYYSVQGLSYKGSFSIYNGDISSLTEEQENLAYFISPYSNKERILEITTYTDDTTFECYVTSSGYELNAYEIGGDGRIVMKFNSHGHVTYFYLNSAGNVVEVNANYFY